MPSFLERELTTLAFCWRVQRRDGICLGFTSHARDLDIDGLRYRAALESLEQLAMPALDLLGVGREASILVLHGVAYSLEARAIHAYGQGGTVRLNGNVGSPLARWAQAMEAALAPCWRA